MIRAVVSLVVTLGCAAFFGACSESPPGARTLDVHAASSLREVFQELGARFSAAHPDVTVAFTFAGSQELRTQLEHGAAADVLALADLEHMNALVSANKVDVPEVFAKNRLVIVCPADSRAVTSLETLPEASRIVIGAPTVPVGRYALRLLEQVGAVHGPELVARIQDKIVSREPNVRQVLAKVTLGEADAALVYRTDALVAKGVRVVELPPELAFDTEYPIAIVRGTDSPELARAWVELVRSGEGRAVLSRAQFRVP